MKKIIYFLAFCTLAMSAESQLSPAISSWLQNTTETGTYYVNGNSTAIDNGILYNCQKVEYSAEFVYVTATGIPAYPTGPFNDGNPSQATNQNGIYKIPLNPIKNEGTSNATTGGNIGIFINGVALFDYRDGVAWNPNTNVPCGGPGNPPCPGGPKAVNDWNRDAIPAERAGFDCSKAHPAMGNYHHHQNPSAFKLDKDVVSEICNLYDADGLYAIDEEKHSPLIGFAYDGFPIYGAYGYKNADGTGGITRIKSGYSLRDITKRNTHADGSTVSNGPDVSSTYFLGYFREDYEFVTQPSEDYLDVHNGRLCVTPEYPEGTYAYFATVDENWNSTYPYVVGPTFYGVSTNRKVTSVTEQTTNYSGGTSSVSEEYFANINLTVFPNPSSDLLAVQINELVGNKLTIDLLDVSGKLLMSKVIYSGSTISYFDTQTLYAGVYLVKLSTDKYSTVRKVVLVKE